MNQQLITFLEDYIENPKLVDINALSELEKGKLPVVWVELFSIESDVVARVLKLWEEFKVDLELVYEYLQSNLITVDLAYYNNQYHIVFGVQSSSGADILYYHSSNPSNITCNPKFLIIPDGLKGFYKYFNGWVYLASDSMGISPIEAVYSLDEYDWEVLENENVEINLDENFVIFENGADGHVCINRIHGINQSMIWWSEELPTLNIDFWSVVDTWMRLGFDDE